MSRHNSRGSAHFRYSERAKRSLILSYPLCKTMNKAIDKIIFFLPEIGILILAFSFLLPWFSCFNTYATYVTDATYIDLLRGNSDKPLLNFSGTFQIHFYLLCLAFLVYLSKIFISKRRFLRFSFILLVLILCLLLLYSALILWIMTEFGVHQTIDIPCPPELGFGLSVLGLVVVLYGTLLKIVKAKHI
jgi:hypothetical protein